MLVAGLMSGTSVDGIDVALVEISGAGFEQRIKPVAFQSIPFAPAVRQAILSISNKETHISRLSQINFLLGELFGEAVLTACREANIEADRLDLIGSHGQTIYHQPVATEICGHRVMSTLQIGEPAVIAETVGKPVIADFRPADMAAGGQGAPLVPYVDYLLYRHATLGRVALNIGGIANLTAIPAGAKPEQVIAFDTGPGNMVIDALIGQFTRGGSNYDRDGKMAASGKVSERLLADLLAERYFEAPPPKSAGREQYGAEFVADFLRRGAPPADLMATATAFTADSIALGIERYVKPVMKIDQLIVSGGGLKNPVLMSRLRSNLDGTAVAASDELGINSDAKEAIAFAVLAYESYHGRAANLPSATGARRACVLGKLVRV